MTKQNGKVGTLNPSTGAIRVRTSARRSRTPSPSASEASSSSRTGGCTASTPRRTAPRRSPGRPATRTPGSSSPARSTPAAGTTPTVMPGGYVAITDNAEPMHVVIYRTGEEAPRSQRRVVCQVPVFGKHTGDTENSLLGAGRSLIVENNYGYQDPFGAQRRCGHHAGLRQGRSQQEREGLQEGVDQPRGERPVGRAEDLDEDGADLHLRAARPTPVAPRATTGPRSTSATGRPSGASTRARASSSTTTTPGSPSRPTGPPTSA